MNLREALRLWFQVEEYLVATRYSVRTSNGKPTEKTYDDVIKRVFSEWHKRVQSAKSTSKVFELIACKASEVERMLKSRKVVPSTPILSNLGSPAKNKCYFACFPLGPVEDSMESIMEFACKMAKIYKGGGGCGIDVSNLRPKGAPVDNGQGEASGPASFLEIYGAVTGVISQGGRRRGALMVQMDADHPDWKLFCEVKDNVPQNHPLSNMNISLNVWNWEEFVRFGKLRYVAEHAWRSGDPGLFFMENQSKATPIPLELKPYYSNPCAEYLSVANTSCNLITVNLVKIALDSNSYEEFLHGVVKAAEAATVFATAVVFFDDGYPLNEIKEKTQELRPVGVGFTGLAEALLHFGVRFGSDRSVKIAKEIQAHLLLGTLMVSHELAEATHEVVKARVENLVPLTLRYLLLSDYIQTFDTIAEFAEKHGGLYHIVTTTQMPTGSTSIFAQVTTTGIEPFWDVPTVRLVRDGDSWKEVELWPLVVFDKEGNLNEDLVKSAKEQTAHSLSAEEQLKVIAAVQELCHTSVSKTVNLPHDATVEDVERVFKRAYELGLKAVSVYRDGCKEVQALKSKAENKQKESEEKHLEPKVHRSPRRVGCTYEFRGPQTLFVTINRNGGNIPCEVLLRIGKSGSAIDGLAQALGIACSVGMQYEPRLARKYAKALRGIDTGDRYFNEEVGIPARSIPDAVALALANELQEAESGKSDGKENKDASSDIAAGMQSRPEEMLTGCDLCPECGRMSVVRSGGCKVCKACGYTTC